MKELDIRCPCQDECLSIFVLVVSFSPFPLPDTRVADPPYHPKARGTDAWVDSIKQIQKPLKTDIHHIQKQQNQ